MYQTTVVFLASHVPNTSRVPSPVMYQTPVVFLAQSYIQHTVPPQCYEVVFQTAVNSYLPNHFLLNGDWGRRFVKF